MESGFYSKLEEAVEKNRFTISVVFPVMGAFLFTISAERPGSLLAFNTLLIVLGTVVMRSPLIVGLKTLLDRKSGIALALAFIFTYCIEYLGLETGFPYGNFEYLQPLGPMIFGLPAFLPLFYLPLVLNSYLLALSQTDNRSLHYFTTLAYVILIDLALDPASISLGVWRYIPEGVFYGAPVSNFLGWTLTSTIIYAIISTGFNFEDLKSRLKQAEYLLDDMFSFTLLWGLVNLYYLNTLPVLSSGMLLGILLKTGRFDELWEKQE